MTAAHPHDVARLRAAIQAWYRAGHRDLPWRRTRDPYAVLVSEVMLQQTQAIRVAARFPTFMSRFLDVQALASAPQADVIAEWSGLGYNRRAVSLHRAAGILSERGWPTDLDGLRSLPGVGAYAARAIGSLAFGWPVGAVDTNVRRWLVRRFGLEADVGADTAAEVQRLADSLASLANGSDDAATWTQASMELGAVVCRAAEPRCNLCPVAAGCPARGGARRVPVARQSPFRGSHRAYRGAVLRALAAAPDRSVSRDGLPMVLVGAAASGALGDAYQPELGRRAIEELVREGLASLEGDSVRLGPAPVPQGHRHGAYNPRDDR